MFNDDKAKDQPDFCLQWSIMVLDNSKLQLQRSKGINIMINLASLSLEVFEITNSYSTHVKIQVLYKLLSHTVHDLHSIFLPYLYILSVKEKPVQHLTK